MSRKRILQTAVDMAMVLLLPLLMARNLIGEVSHEWMGTAMILLFLCHHALNVRWYQNLFHGRYNPVRILNTAVNFLLLLCMVLMGVSGVMLSAHVFAFLNLSKGASLARTIHLPCAFWGFLLMSFHAGLHWNTVMGRIRRMTGKQAGEKTGIFLRIPVLVVSIYGAFAFFRREFPSYLLLQSAFMFYDFEEPVVFYLADMAAVMVLFASLGYFGMKLLIKAGQKQT